MATKIPGVRSCGGCGECGQILGLAASGMWG